MKRRKFLQASAAASLPFFVNGIPISAASSSSVFKWMNSGNDNVLVLVQLFGGNDGLQTLLPLDQYDRLQAARQNLIIPESSVIKLDDIVGFHPVMTGMKNLWDDGKMNVLQSVGYPNQNRSHFRSTDIWSTGSPADETWTTGWLGRYFQKDHPDFPEGYPTNDFADPFAINVGTNITPTCQGEIGNFSMAIADPFNLSDLASGGADEVPNTPYGKELTFLRTAIAQTNAYSEVVEQAALAGNSLSTLYPDDSLAEKLKTVAYLISGGLKTKVYVVTLGGFDTHGGQVEAGDTTTGEHAELLQRVSDALVAFQDDLRLLGLEERVIGMTYSEFGRRIKANDSLGTDHGDAAPLFMFGSCIQPGMLGINPEIPEDVTASEAIPMQYDFRNIYGTILTDWFEVPENEVRQLLFDDFQPLPIINPCATRSASLEFKQKERFAYHIEATSFPNPCNGYCTIAFESENEWTRVSLYDAYGYELRVLSEGMFDSGAHRLKVETRDLVPGNYYFRIQTKYGQVTKGFVKG